MVGFEPIQLTAWASNSGEVKYKLDHSATGHYIFSEDLQRDCIPANIWKSHEKFCRDLNLQPLHLQSATLTTQLLRLVIKEVGTMT